MILEGLLLISDCYLNWATDNFYEDLRDIAAVIDECKINIIEYGHYGRREVRKFLTKDEFTAGDSYELLQIMCNDQDPSALAAIMADTAALMLEPDWQQSYMGNQSVRIKVRLPLDGYRKYLCTGTFPFLKMSIPSPGNGGP